MTAAGDTVSLRLKLRYPDLDAFIAGYAENTSSAGLFLRTKAPNPAGTRIRFELSLADGTPALAGVGVVVAVRNEAPEGMAVRFRELEGDSRALVDRIVSAHGNGPLAPTPLSLDLGGTSGRGLDAWGSSEWSAAPLGGGGTTDWSDPIAGDDWSAAPASWPAAPAAGTDAARPAPGSPASESPAPADPAASEAAGPAERGPPGKKRIASIGLVPAGQLPPRREGPSGPADPAGVRPEAPASSLDDEETADLAPPSPSLPEADDPHPTHPDLGEPEADEDPGPVEPLVEPPVEPLVDPAPDLSSATAESGEDLLEAPADPAPAHFPSADPPETAPLEATGPVEEDATEPPAATAPEAGPRLGNEAEPEPQPPGSPEPDPTRGPWSSDSSAVFGETSFDVDLASDFGPVEAARGDPPLAASLPPFEFGASTEAWSPPPRSAEPPGAESQPESVDVQDDGATDDTAAASESAGTAADVDPVPVEPPPGEDSADPAHAAEPVGASDVRPGRAPAETPRPPAIRAIPKRNVTPPVGAGAEPPTDEAPGPAASFDPVELDADRIELDAELAAPVAAPLGRAPVDTEPEATLEAIRPSRPPADDAEAGETDDDETSADDAELRPEASSSEDPPPEPGPPADLAGPSDLEAHASSFDLPIQMALAVGIDLGARWVRGGYIERGEMNWLTIGSSVAWSALVATRPDGSLVVGPRARRIADASPDCAISPVEVLTSVQNGALPDRFPIAAWGPQGGVVTLGEHRFEFHDLLLAFARGVREAFAAEVPRAEFSAFIGMPAALEPAMAGMLRSAMREAGFEQADFHPVGESLVRAYGLDDRPIDDVLIVHVEETHALVAVAQRAGRHLAVTSREVVRDISSRLIDDAAIDLILQNLSEQDGAPHDDPVTVGRLRDALDFVRSDLKRSPTLELRVTIPSAGGAAGVGVERSVQLSRSRLFSATESTASALHDRVLGLLRERHLSPSAVGAVILAGPGGSFPPFAQVLEQLCEQPPLGSIPAPHGLAVGLARWGRNQAQSAIAQRPDTLDASIGIELPGGRFRPLLPAGADLPLRFKRQQPVRPHEGQVELRLYQGDSEYVRGASYIGALVIGPLPGADEGSTKIELDMEVDNDGVLRARIAEPISGLRGQLVAATQQTPAERRKTLPARPPRPAPNAGATSDGGESGFLKRLFGRKS